MQRDELTDMDRRHFRSGQFSDVGQTVCLIVDIGVLPTGYIDCDGEPMPYWLPRGVSADEIGVRL